jgi:hypothetical protein
LISRPAGRDDLTMTRVEVIQRILDGTRARRYLEIGVQRGDTFLPLRVKHKTAVDPVFSISRRKKLDWIRWNFSNVRNRYYETSSDEFFTRKASWLARHRVDVAFVDGLHTYEQSLRDVYGALRYVKEDGVVVDDCNPRPIADNRPDERGGCRGPMVRPGR